MTIQEFVLSQPVRKPTMPRPKVRIDRSVMLDVMKQSNSINDMSKRLGVSANTLTRLTKETVIDHSGITVYDVLMSLPRNQMALKFDVNHIVEISKTVMTLESLSKELGCSYHPFLKFVKQSVNPQTGENLLSSLKNQIKYNQVVRKYRSNLKNLGINH